MSFLIKRYPFLYGAGSILDIGGTRCVNPGAYHRVIPGFEADARALSKDRQKVIEWANSVIEQKRLESKTGKK